MVTIFCRYSCTLLRRITLLATKAVVFSCLFSTLSWANEDTSLVTTQLLKASLSKTKLESLSLKEALTIAQEENQSYKIALANVKRAKARYYLRLSELLPDITLFQPFNHYEGAVQTTLGSFLEVDRKNFQPQMVFRFSLFQGGRQILQARIAKKELGAQRETEKSFLQQALRQTALAYYDLQRSLADLAVAQKQLLETQASFQLNQSRLESGLGTRLDVLQSEAQFIEAQEQAIELTRASESVALRLNETLNLSVFSKALPTHDAMVFETLIPQEMDFTTALTLAYQNNPRLKALEKQLESLTQLFKPTSLGLALLPEVYTQLRTGKTGMTLSQAQSFREVSYGIGFTFHNLSISRINQYREFRAQIEGLKAQLEAERNTIERELSSMWLQAKARQAQIDLARKKLVVAEETFLTALEQLKTGKGRNIDILEAQTNLTQARRNLNALILEYNQSQVDLVYGLGLASIDTLTQGISMSLGKKAQNEAEKFYF